LTSPPWALLGAGSLGSKIALHLARAGQAPISVIDRAYLSPHNAARHALVPAPGRLEASWIRAKAEALVEAITGLGQSAETHIRDAVSLLAETARRRTVIPKKTLFLVNATTSLVAREAIGAVPADALPRVIETSLFGDGAAGLLTIEGPKRNPYTSDLIAEAYATMRTDMRLRALVLTGDAALDRQRTGEGCGSATMAISDARISMMAAPMAEAIGTLLRDGLPPDTGRVLIACLGDDGLGQTWQQQSLAPSIVTDVEDGHGWTVRKASAGWCDRTAGTALGDVWRGAAVFVNVSLGLSRFHRRNIPSRHMPRAFSLYMTEPSGRSISGSAVCAMYDAKSVGLSGRPAPSRKHAKNSSAILQAVSSKVRMEAIRSSNEPEVRLSSRSRNLVDASDAV
jgi:hypothetical protein